MKGEFRDTLLRDICNMYVGVNECLSLFSTVFDEFWCHASLLIFTQCRLVVEIFVNTNIVKVITVLMGGYKLLSHTEDVCEPE
jgi:hypothetical protein